jgi:peptide/nickel transport system substrate-binding protein
MKRRLALSLVVVAALAATAGFVSRPGAASPSRSGATAPVLRVGFAGLAISTLNIVTGPTAPFVTSLGLETLMRFGNDGKIHPWLAQSMSQANPVTYVYHLRRGVKFWDGAELTSADVVASLDYNRSAGSQSAFFFASVKNVAARDRYTVVVTLKHPDASWQFVPTQYGTEIVEKRFYEAHRSTIGKPGVLTMGTGPWKFDSIDPTTGVELSANPDYWGGKTKIDHISVKFFANENSEALAFRAHAIDAAPYITNPRGFASTAGSKVIGVPSCQQAYFSINTKTAPWNDVHVRRAVAYAINRADLIKAAGGYASPLYTFIPPSQLRSVGSPSAVSSLLRSLPAYQYSLAKARAELAKSAYPHGFSTTLEAGDFGYQVIVSQVIAGELKQIGIKAQLKSVEFGKWLSEQTGPAAKRPTNVAISGCTLPDPSFYMYLLGEANTHSGGWNTANYAPPEVDRLITAGIATQSPARRLAVYGSILKRLGVDVPYIPLFSPDADLAISSKFGWPTYSANAFNTPWALEIRPKA